LKGIRCKRNPLPKTPDLGSLGSSLSTSTLGAEEWSTSLLSHSLGKDFQTRVTLDSPRLDSSIASHSDYSPEICLATVLYRN